MNDLIVLPSTGRGGTVTSNSNPPYLVNSEAFLKCSAGYTLPFTNKSKVVVENNILKWKPSHLECIPVLCRPPPDIENGSLKPFKLMYQFADSIEYVCDTGYNLKANRKFHCSATGQWQPPVENIKCIEDTEWCPPLKSPMYGSLTLSKGRSFNSKATLTCDDGSSHERICQENKSWSNDDVVCPLPCPDMVGVKFSPFKKFNLVVCNGEFVKVNCINGQWQYKHPYCNKIQNDVVASNNLIPNPQIINNNNNNNNSLPNPQIINNNNLLPNPQIINNNNLLPKSPIINNKIKKDFNQKTLSLVLLFIIIISIILIPLLKNFLSK